MLRLFDVAEEAGTLHSVFEYAGETRQFVNKRGDLHPLGQALGDASLDFYSWNMPPDAKLLLAKQGFSEAFRVTQGGGTLENLEERIDLLSATEPAWAFWEPNTLISKRCMVETSIELPATFVFENSWVRFNLVGFESFGEGTEPRIGVFIDGSKIGIAELKKPGVVQAFELSCTVKPGEHTVRIEKPAEMGKLFIHGLSVGPASDSIVIALEKTASADIAVTFRLPTLSFLARRLLNFVSANSNWNKQSFDPLAGPFDMITMATESEIRKRTFRTLFLEGGGSFQADVDVPRGGVLVLNYGFLDNLFDTLNLTLTEPGDEEALLSRRYHASEIKEKIWYQATEDLTEFAGRRVRIRVSMSGLEGMNGAALIGEPLIRSSLPSGSGKPNIVLLSFDTLRADRLSLYGYERDTSPFMKSLAGSCVTFKSAYSQASWTLPSHASMLTGLYPQLLNNVNANFDYHVNFPESIPSVVSALKGDSYYCLGFVEGGYVSSFHGFAREFDFYNELNYADIDSTTLTESGDRLVKHEEVSSAAEWIRKHGNEGPFFMFAHTFAVHAPYIPPPKYDRLFGIEVDRQINRNLARLNEAYTGRGGKVNEEELRGLNLLYDRQVRWADDLFAKLFNSLEETGLLDNTIVIITSDHGEEFKEHERLGHSKTVYNESIRVPLLIRFPGGKWAGRVIEGEVGVIDIVPTLLDYLEIESESMLQGRSLLPLITDGEDGQPKATVFSSNWYQHRTQICAVSDGLKYILNFGSDGRILEEIYDLKLDPGERDNLIDAVQEDRREDVELLRAELLRFIAENAPGWNVLVYPESEKEDLAIAVGNLDPRPASWFLESERVEGINLVIANNVLDVRSTGKPILLMFDGEYNPSFEVNINSSNDRRVKEVTVGAPSLRTASPPLRLSKEDEAANLRVPLALNEIATRYLALLWRTSLNIVFGEREAAEQEESEEMNKALRNLGYLQ